jgi:hypothetical protein
MIMVITKRLCKKRFRDFSFHEFQHYAPLTPSQRNFDHLPHVLWFDGPDVILIQWLWLNRDFTISAFLLHWVLCLSMLRFAKLRYGVRSTVQIWAWFNGCDWVAISYIVKSTFLLPCLFDISNTRSSKLRHGLESTVQIKAWSDGSDYIAISHIAISGFLMLINFDISNSWSLKLW